MIEPQTVTRREPFPRRLHPNPHPDPHPDPNPLKQAGTKGSVQNGGKILTQEQYIEEKRAFKRLYDKYTKLDTRSSPNPTPSEPYPS